MHVLMNDRRNQTASHILIALSPFHNSVIIVVMFKPHFEILCVTIRHLLFDTIQ